jgi:hypothetical protein
MAQPARAKIKKAKPAADATLIYINSAGKVTPTTVVNLADCAFSVTYPANKTVCEIKCIVTFKKTDKEDDYTVSLSS